jgi:hypothetical protein
MKPEYKEGPEVAPRKRTMTALFRVPKPKVRKEPKAAIERKSEKTDKD